MKQGELIPHLFRTEARKITTVLCKLFGIEHIETAEDIVSDTFLSALENWTYKGIPKNPTAWIYTVAKNKAKNQIRRNSIFSEKIAPSVSQHSTQENET
jgi:RNA polymerase sigma-70 factor (ECF subfamily)